LLSKYFSHYTNNYISALELALEYARRKPSVLPELVKTLRENMLFDREDEEYSFVRQIEFFNLLIKHHNKGEIHYTAVLIAMAETFLSHQYNITKGGRNNTITIYQYRLELTNTIKELRDKIWNTIFDAYDNYPDDIFDLINKYKTLSTDASKEILQYDLTLLLPFIDNKLDPNNFKHAYSVQELIIWLERNKGINKSSYQALKRKFFTSDYEYFRKLDWNMRRGKLEYEFTNYEEYQKLKENDVRLNFRFKTKDDFKDFHKAIKNITSVDRNNLYGIDQSLSIVLEENFIQDNELGFQLLQSILDNYDPSLNYLARVFSIITNTSEEWVSRLWNLISCWENENCLFVKLLFFECLPEKYASEYYKDELIKLINLIDKNCFLSFGKYKNFISIDSSILERLLEIVVNKISDNELRIILPYDFFMHFPIIYIKNGDLLYKSYLQQETLQQHFDYNREGLKKLVEMDGRILAKYITSSFNEDNVLHEFNHDNFSFVWSMPNHEMVLEECLSIAIENNYYLGILEHPINAFFNSLDEVTLLKAKQFIFNYISKNSTDTEKMNAVFDVIRHSLKDIYEEALLTFLSVNTSLDNFKNIYWRGNGGIYSGKVIVGELHAKEWENILNIVNKAEDQLNTIPIKNYLKEQIAYEYRSAEHDRKIQFIDPRE